MEREVQLVKKNDGTLCLVAVEKFFEREKYDQTEPVQCHVIPPQPYGWWIYEKTNKGGASDMIGDEHIVREFKEADAESILKNEGRCYVEVNHKNKLVVPTNGYGQGKIVIFLERKTETLSA